VAFVRRQGRLDDPLIDLRLFRTPAFSASLAAYMLGVFAVFGGFLFIFQYLQLVLGLSPLAAGLWTVPSFGAFIVGSMLAPMAVRRVPPGSLMAGGLAVGALGFALLALVDADTGLAVLVPASVVFSLGLAPVFTLATDQVVSTAPPERAGGAAAISETGAELGGALGIAVLGSIGTALYRSHVADGLPAGVPKEAADAARDTLGGAVAASQGLADPLAVQLLDTSREAFTQGLQVAAIASAVVAAATAVLVHRVLRGPRRDGPEALGFGADVPARQATGG
jgi:DHA2 family multidrug resistance protein-like MFS transporter